MFYKSQERPDHKDADKGELQVIGVGLPRTGTTSLTNALSYLLKGSCFHGSRLPKLSEEEYDFWLRALGSQAESNNKPTTEEWRKMFQFERASLDMPSILFYKELMIAFPQVESRCMQHLQLTSFAALL